MNWLYLLLFLGVIISIWAIVKWWRRSHEPESSVPAGTSLHQQPFIKSPDNKLAGDEDLPTTEGEQSGFVSTGTGYDVHPITFGEGQVVDIDLNEGVGSETTRP